MEFQRVFRLFLYFDSGTFYDYYLDLLYGLHVLYEKGKKRLERWGLLLQNQE